MANQTRTLINEPRGRKPEQGPETLYSRAKKYADDRLGSRVVQAANWRMAFWGAMAFALICLIGLICSALKPPLPPFVVEVDHATGAANVVGRLGSVQYEPQLAEIQFFIGKFLTMVRTVSTDPVVIKKNWIDAYHFTRQSAATALNQWAQDPDGQLSRIGKESVSIEVISVNHVADSKSYQARWRESVYTDSGALKETYIMSGVFTIEIEQPKDESTILINPLGIFIKSFQWTREAKDNAEQLAPNESINQQTNKNRTNY
jgi:type IV secretion system protein VirB5